MIRTSLRGYQQIAFDRAIEYDGFCLLPEQRTGKTLISLSLVDRRKPDLLFIMCPLKAIKVWQDQIAKHLVLDWDCEIIIENYEQYTRSPKDRRRIKGYLKRRIKKGQTFYVIADEGHRIKKRGSATSTFLRSLGRIATWRLLLTGTPIAQGIQDAWALFDFIMPGIFGKYEEFAESYLRFGGWQMRQIIGYRRLQAFNKIFHRYSYRITLREARKSEGQNSAKIYRKKIMVKLDSTSRAIYDELSESLSAEVNGTIVSTPLMMTLTGKLQQLCGGYLVHSIKVPGKKKKNYEIIPVGQEKIKALIGLLTKLGNRKIVICVRYKHEIKNLAELMVDLKKSYKIIAGGVDFDGVFDTQIVILQVASGVAIDLAESNSYIFYSWDFSHINHEQSKFRVQSFDTAQVNYWYLICEDTVDEDIYMSTVKKRNLATLICDRYRRDRDGSSEDRQDDRREVSKSEGRNKEVDSKTHKRGS